MPGSANAVVLALWSELLHPQYNGLTVADVLELERVEMDADRL
ncbi:MULTISPECIES: hypothetical protein [unclassified Pseudomonas]|jgi:hypothetical protein